MKPSSSIVYVVDDDVSVREALASLIGSVALNVECFASPEGASASARSGTLLSALGADLAQIRLFERRQCAEATLSN